METILNLTSPKSNGYGTHEQDVKSVENRGFRKHDFGEDFGTHGGLRPPLG
jgi:hypothetical protein